MELLSAFAFLIKTGVLAFLIIGGLFSVATLLLMIFETLRKILIKLSEGNRPIYIAVFCLVILLVKIYVVGYY